MKRDMELVRDILFYIEKNYSAGDDTISVEIENFSNSTIYEHCKLIYEAGLIQKFDNLYTDAGGDDVYVGNLTNSGYDYLDKIRDSSIWIKVKKK